MGIPFTKMHGLGNDYIYVNGFEVGVDDPGSVAKQISDRHRGVGSDGLVLILPSERADFRMRMWNSDGSEAEQCGNALRCIARYVFERGLTDRTAFTIQTGAGDVRAVLEVQPATNGGRGRVTAVETDLGPPVLTPERIPVTGSKAPDRLVGESWAIDGTNYTVSAVSMGNPHLVVEVESVAHAPVTTLGPRLEHDPRFPRRTNVGFVEVVSPSHLRLRVWERGAGETLACGSGAAAATVAMVLRGRARSPLAIDLPGGRLETSWQEGQGVRIKGPATFICDGTFIPD